MVKIEEYLQTIPGNMLSGEDIRIPDRSFRDIFRFAGMGRGDVFYHLGCGDARGVRIAASEFGVRRAVGIDNSREKIAKAEEEEGGAGGPGQGGARWQLVCSDIRESDIADATVILFWFTDDDVLDPMMDVFERLRPGTRIVTVWGPLPGCLPDRVDFPYVINRIPLRRARDLREQLLAVLDVKCVDFVTAWEFAERYTKAVGSPEVKNDRFLTIIQTLVIWINAKRMGVACGRGIPAPIRTYAKLMKMNFDIDFEHLLPEEGDRAPP